MNLQKSTIFSIAIIICSYFAITEVTPWYFNHYQDNNGAAYANVHKVLMEHPKSFPLQHEVYIALKDERFTANEYSSFIKLYNSEHGALEGVPSGIDYSKEEYKAKIYDIFELGDLIKCVSSTGLRSVEISQQDNMYYGEFSKPSYDAKKANFIDVNGNKIQLKSNGDWTCQDNDLDRFRITDKPQVLALAS